MSRVFVPALDAVVATDFIHAGVQCKRGDPFPHRELKLSEFSLRGLWLANLIDFVTPAPTTDSKPSVKQPPPRR
jgi:hypothetical protein